MYRHRIEFRLVSAGKMSEPKCVDMLFTGQKRMPPGVKRYQPGKLSDNVARFSEP